jgi:hypothetical protein
METFMKAKKTVLALVVLLTGSILAQSAFAQRRHHHHHGPRISFGIGFGAPFFGYPYYAPYYPRYYYPAPVVVEREPVYIERDPVPAQPQAQPQAPAAGYWYYCAQSGAYYPYVKECAGGWQRVAPQP